MLLFASGALAQNEQALDFALLDHTGTFHQLSYYGDHEAVVIISQANEDDGLSAVADELSQLSTTWRERQVEFLLLNATATQTREQVGARMRELGLALPVLMDEAQLVARRQGLTHAGQIQVIDPAQMRVLYRDALDDEAPQRLEQVLNAIADEQPITISGRKPVAGQHAELSFTDLQRYDTATPSYTRDIVPILEQHCVSCHHDGGIGPWSMNAHLMVQGFAPMIREVIVTRRMPPGQIDTHLSHPIEDTAGLSIEEQRKLVAWIDAGAPADGEVDPLTELTFDNPKFSLGEPDLVYKVPPQELPATGAVDYRYVPVKLNLDRDVWVKAMEFVPGDHKALHHVIAYLQAPADKRARSKRSAAARGESIGGFAPGRAADSFGERGGRLIPKGSNLLLQMHYTTYGKATVDETEFAIYLHDEPPEWVMTEAIAGQRRFMVPPFVQEHPLIGEFEVERDAYIHAMMPHMHYRGKHMRYSALYPDGTEEILLSVPKYNFNWQFNYKLKEPVFLPAGSKIIARGAMDNSLRNPGNPDPSKPVHFGLQTMHEMFFGFTTIRYVDDNPQDMHEVALSD